MEINEILTRFVPSLAQVSMCNDQIKTQNRIYQLAGLLALSLLLPDIAIASELSPSVQKSSPMPDTLANEDLSHVLEVSKIAVGAVKGIENGGRDDARVGVESAVATQVLRPTSGAQDDAPDLSASTSSRDLQLVEPVTAVTDDTQSPHVRPADIAQTETNPSQSSQWHFLLEPYVYIPISISGSAEFQGSEFQDNFTRDFDNPSRDFEFSPSEIRTALENSLNFAFLGALEAWTPNYNVGILTNVDYVSLSTDATFDRSVRRPGFANFIPTELDADLDIQVLNVDLAASYRFYDSSNANPEGINTEFDLGALVFDVLGGVNLVSLNTDLDLSTNLGGEGEFSRNKTVISPLIGGRFRWNATPTLAVLLSGSVSGFGIEGLTRYSVQGGVNWMFSGNTSLGAGYRFASLDYSSDQIDLNVDQNGPYLNIGFRF
jgi:hypothetical protein